MCNVLARRLVLRAFPLEVCHRTLYLSQVRHDLRPGEDRLLTLNDDGRRCRLCGNTWWRDYLDPESYRTRYWPTAAEHRAHCTRFGTFKMPVYEQNGECQDSRDPSGPYVLRCDLHDLHTTEFTYIDAGLRYTSGAEKRRVQS
jgi:hypothetical protein